MRPPHTKRAILIVEDDNDIRDALADVFEMEGFVVSTAADGAEALKLLGIENYSPCVILLDLMMPVMDGLQFRAIQTRDARLAEIPVVVLTANASPPSAADLLVMAVVSKPLNLPKLLSLVEANC